MRRFLVRDNEDYSAEAAAVVWYLDAKIAFCQFDNPLFRSFAEALGARQLPSSTTLVDTVIPVLHQFVIEANLAVLRTWRSFWTTFDVWTWRNSKFLSQSYHGICVGTMKYRILAMDLVPANVQLFAEGLAGLLLPRQEYWTSNLDLIFNGAVPDGAANVQAAAAIMSGDDHGCYCNHVEKGWYEAVELADPAFALDLESLAHLYVSVAASSTVNSVLKSYEWLHSVTELSLVLFNDTRWEGRVLTLRNAISLVDSLPVLKTFAVEQSIAGPADFLEEEYF